MDEITIKGVCVKKVTPAPGRSKIGLVYWRCRLGVVGLLSSETPGREPRTQKAARKEAKEGQEILARDGAERSTPD